MDPRTLMQYAIARGVILLLMLAVAFLAGCSTMNNAGIGGAPQVRCDVETGLAFLSDPLIGSNEQMKLALDRRLKAVDSICATLSVERAKAQAALIVQRRVVDEMLKAAEQMPLSRLVSPDEL